jgi:hypothetical protein
MTYTKEQLRQVAVACFVNARDLYEGRCFKAVDPVSEGKAKFIAIDEQPNHQVVHLFRLRKAQRPTH